MKKSISTKALLFVCLLITVFQAKAQDWESMTPMPTPRAYTTSCLLDGEIYVIGGTVSKASSAMAVVEAYNWEADEWDTSIADLPAGLCDASAEVVNGKIYVIGGRPQYLGTAFDSVFIYDPAINTWTSKPLPFSRASYASAVVGDSIFVMGGGGYLSLTDNVAAFHPDTDTWNDKTPLPTTPRTWFTTEVASGKIYAMGGIALGVSQALVQEYDPVTDSWTEKTDMPDTKFLHGSAYVPMNHSIYVFGGITSFDAFSPGMWRYDVSSDSWSDEGIALPETISAFAYSNVQAAEDEFCLYAIGGALPDFWNIDAGQFAADIVYRYCDVIIPTREIGKAVAVSPQIVPNPFGVTTTIRYKLSNAAEVSLQIHDLSGKEVATLFTGFQGAGEYLFEWNAEGLPAGVYVYTLRTGELVVTGKIIKNQAGW